MCRRYVMFLFLLGFVYLGSLCLIFWTSMRSADVVYSGGGKGPVSQQEQGDSPLLRWCQHVNWHKLRRKGPVALASHPGSGNTWLRYLLQQTTGIYTGSIYMDLSLRNNGFPAENVSDGSVLVVKTHETPKSDSEFTAAILLIRNPREAIQAEFNRQHRGHIGFASRRAYLAADIKINWVAHVQSNVRGWETFHMEWLTGFLRPLLVVTYSRLVENTEDTLWRILSFLNQSVTEDMMRCAIKQKEGIYRRKKGNLDFDPFTRPMMVRLQQAEDRVFGLIKKLAQDSKIFVYL